MDGLVFQHIALIGYGVGVCKFLNNGVEWRDRGNIVVKEFDKTHFVRAGYCMFGSRVHLSIYMNDGNYFQLDGFSKSNLESLNSHFDSVYGLSLDKETVSSLLLHP
jgi:hypothetical protein